MNLFIRYKKIILAISFAIIVLFIGYFIYITFFKSTLTPLTKKIDDSVKTPTASLPTARTGQGQIIKQTDRGMLPLEINDQTIKPSEKAIGGLTKTIAVNNTPSLGVYLDNNNSNIKYYNETDGKFYNIDKNGNINLLTDKIFHQIQKITWSPAKNKAILEYPDGANTIYDFDNDKQITLPKHLKDFNFSPDGKQIVMKSMGLDPDNRWLTISNENGSKIKPIVALGLKDATVYPSWSPNKQSIAMYTEGIDLDRQRVYFVGLNNENFKSTIIEGRNFQPKWSPDGDKLLYSVYSNKNNLKPTLWIVNAKGNSIGSGRKNLKIETWANKCTFFSNAELYCAVPHDLEEGAGLFPDLAKNTNDHIFKINTKTGLKKLIAIPDKKFNISNIIISQNNKYLYFTDETTKKIYKIQLN